MADINDEHKFINVTVAIAQTAVNGKLDELAEIGHVIYTDCPYPPTSFQAEGYRHGLNCILKAIWTMRHGKEPEPL